MAFKSAVKDINIISEKRSGEVKAICKVAWGDGPFKHAVRKVVMDHEDGPMPTKGIDLTEGEMHTLATELVKMGFGYIDDMTDAIKERLEDDTTKLEQFESIFTAEKKNKFSVKLIDS